MIDTLKSGLTFQKTITMMTEACCNCGITFGMPSDFREVCLADPDKWFYCPNGHRQHYTKSTEAKLREEMERQKRDYEWRLNNSANQLMQETKAKKNLARELSRVHKGVCPCCDRTFANLQKHMETKHPEVAQVQKPNPLHQKITKKGSKGNN